MLRSAANFVESTDSVCNGITSYGKVWMEDAKKKKEAQSQSVSLLCAPASCFWIDRFRFILFYFFIIIFYSLSLCVKNLWKYLLSAVLGWSLRCRVNWALAVGLK